MTTLDLNVGVFSPDGGRVFDGVNFHQTLGEFSPGCVFTNFWASFRRGESLPVLLHFEAGISSGFCANYNERHNLLEQFLRSLNFHLWSQIFESNIGG